MSNLTTSFVNVTLSQVHPLYLSFIKTKVVLTLLAFSLSIPHQVIYSILTLLQNHPALSFEDACTVDRSIHNTYQEAVMEMGLCADCNEAQLAMEEAILTLKTPQ